MINMYGIELNSVLEAYMHMGNCLYLSLDVQRNLYYNINMKWQKIVRQDQVHFQTFGCLCW